MRRRPRERADDVLHLVRDRRETVRQFSPTQHEGRAEHGFLAVVRGRAGAQFVAQDQRRHIADANGHAFLGADDDVLDIVTMFFTCPGERIRYCSPLRSM